MIKKFILLVEDNPDDVALAQRALRKNQPLSHLIVAANGFQALDFLFCRGEHANRNPADLPAVILLDLKMPKLSGIEVLRQIRHNPATRYLPVVILTSSNEEIDLVASYHLCANSFIRKPVDFNEFNNLMVRLALYWLGDNHVPSAAAMTLPPPAEAWWPYGERNTPRAGDGITAAPLDGNGRTPSQKTV